MNVTVTFSDLSKDELQAVNEIAQSANDAERRVVEQQLTANGEEMPENIAPKYATPADYFASRVQAEIENHAGAVKQRRFATLTPLGNALITLPASEQIELLNQLIAVTRSAGHDVTELETYRDDLLT